jgi:hypothetical protein
VTLELENALQSLALARLCGLRYSCDVDNVSYIVAAAGRDDLGVYGVLRYAEDGVFVLVEVGHRVVLQIDLHLHVVILVVTLHGHIAVIFDNFLGLVCVENVVFIVVVELGLVVGLLRRHCSGSCFNLRYVRCAVFCRL